MLSKSVGVAGGGESRQRIIDECGVAAAVVAIVAAAVVVAVVAVASAPLWSGLARPVECGGGESCVR